MDISKPTILQLKAELEHPIESKMNGTFNVTKKMNGLDLEVRCYKNENGVDVGSCSNVDVCESFMEMIDATPENCPLSLINNGINCECPLIIDKNEIDIEVKISSYPKNVVSQYWFEGPLNMKLKIQEYFGSLFCLDLDFTVEKKII